MTWASLIPGIDTDLLLAAIAYGAAMAQLAMLAAVFRCSGLHRHGLIEEEALGDWLRGMLASSRRYVVAVGVWYLAFTVTACTALVRFASVRWPEGAAYRHYLGVILIVMVAWSVGGLAAKRLGARHALGVLNSMGRVFAPLNTLLTPWTALLVRSGDGGDDTLWTAETMPHLSTGEIRDLIRGDVDEVNLEDDEREMIQSIFGFHETAVREIMVPRIDVISLESSQNVLDVVATIVACRHSRIPIHEGTIDKVVGILYAKDLLSLVGEDRRLAGTQTVGELARPANFFPESKRLDEVLEEFRAERFHMAVVIDEYGGTAGLVTLEDVLEEIVGEIEDEFDEQENLFVWLDDRSLRIDPKIDLEDLQEVLGVEIPLDEGSETLAGLVYEAAGKVPSAGDRVEIAGLEVVVEKVEDQRILQVKMVSESPLPGAVARTEREIS